MVEGMTEDERLVPATAMGGRYLEVHAKAEPPRVWKRGERTAHQRSLAERDLEAIDSLAGDFIQSVERFEGYQPRDQAFYDERDPDALKGWLDQGDPTTDRLAARIERDGVETQSPLPALTYIDRELVPSRTTGPAHFEHPEGTKIRLDLLFSIKGQPVVAEVKALGDENAYYALIQGLAACAQLAPSAQRKRLRKRYGDLKVDGPVQLWIVLANHNSRGRDKAALLTISTISPAGSSIANPSRRTYPRSPASMP